MAEERLLKVRKDLEMSSHELTDIGNTLKEATREDDAVPLDSFHMETISSQLDNLRHKFVEYFAMLNRNESDETARSEDVTSRARLLLEWDRLRHCSISLANVYGAEKVSSLIHKSIKRLEMKQRENPERTYKEALRRLEPQMADLRAMLHRTTLLEDHILWTSLDDYEDRIDSMLSAEPTTLDHKDVSKVHVSKGSYKIAALAIPKFSGKIQQWVTFWQEFNHAVHVRTDMDDAVKMVYLKQAITDPGLNTSISDLGIEAGSYTKAVKLLHDRYDKPRVMHRLICESLRDIKPTTSSKNSLSEMADQAQHILLGLTRLKSLGASEVITSLVESAMGAELREHWLNYTAGFKNTPTADKVIEFLRMRADRAEGNSVSSGKPQFKSSAAAKSGKANTKHKGIAAATPVATPTVSAPTGALPGSAPPTGNSYGGSGGSTQGRREFIPCKYSCPLCPENHYCFHCNLFKAYSTAQKKAHVTLYNLCINCLKPGHNADNCRSTYRCSTCRGKHNSLVHEEQTALASSGLGLASATAVIPEGLLMTANVSVTGSNGLTKTVRAFIDGGSSVTLISNKLKTALALKPTGGSMAIDGVAGFVGEIQHPIVSLTLSSPQDRSWERHITAISMPKVVRDLPLKDASVTKDMPHLKHLVLADPLYYRVGPVDMLLGLNVFPHIFRTGREEGPPNTPSAWDTVFGWTVLGVFSQEGCAQALSASAFVSDPTHSQLASDRLLTRFWKSEEPQSAEDPLSPEEQRVEEHFKTTHEFIKSENRYRVTLPRTMGELTLGESRSRALHRAQANEKSLIKKKRWPEFQSVMQEYLDLGHAIAVSPQEVSLPVAEHYYMPVHSVVKETSTSTKVRAVFDASAPTASGVSLNDLLAVGPTLQPSLEQTLLRFRTYGIAISGDISKMYREILLSPADRPMHRFLWRKEVGEPWQDYQMERVTFGVTSSPYMAIKTLMQVADDFASEFPEAQRHIKNSFYVDDFFGGANSVSEASLLREQITNILSKGGFSLRKWRSSSQEVLDSIPQELREEIPDCKMLDSHSACYPKALGLVWDSRQDCMATNIEVSEHYSSTKRGVVSDIARTFDVLGWLSPVILEMKVLYRTLWQLKLGWDQQVPEDLKIQHEAWRQALPSLATIRLARHYFGGRKPSSVSLHGFSDASKKAFAAVVYIRAEYEDGPPTSELVLAKTRVAPLLERTIPELELCGAHLLAKLLESTSSTLDTKKDNIYAYTDSTIVLAWLDGSPKRYRLYVSNRISKTVRLMPPKVWHHVPTNLNPADCASRGISAAALLDHPLWWHGPPWRLAQPLSLPDRPGRTAEEQTLAEEHQVRQTQIVAALLPSPDTRLEECANTWKKVVRVVCWIRRFVARAKKKTISDSRFLSVAEFNQADLLLKQRSQLRAYSTELNQLNSEPPQPLSSKCAILALQPEINHQGLLCVGGRLRKALIEEPAKHPVLLSAKDIYTKLLFEHYHNELMHGGPTVILAHSGSMFHVTGARRLARDVCRSCITCRKVAAKVGPQLMGQLPPERVDPDVAFTTTGLDYAGPYLLKEGYVRRPVEIKAWMAVFVCFTCKAVHLELVKDATAASLIACLSRFCCRRGRPSVIWSDNGSTMIGARNELASLYKVLQNQDTQESVNAYLLSQKIE